jgi:hypothetical protein
MGLSIGFEYLSITRSISSIERELTNIRESVMFNNNSVYHPERYFRLRILRLLSFIDG